jgi:parallel beta-helix repeat protein
MLEPRTPLLNRFLLTCFLLSLAAGSSQAQRTIHVPGDVGTIQAGIDSATSGDIVLVAPGKYVENIDFKGKNITLSSSDGAGQTIIDGNQNGVVVTFKAGESRQAVISGFTIQNSALSNAALSDGIFVSGANPTISGNIITNNRGYGIEVNFGGALIQGNTISYTTTSGDPRFDFGCDYDDGSGIAVGGTTSYDVEITNNTIENNIGRCGGGGIRLFAAPVLTISNNIIRNNQALGEGGGIWMVNGDQVYILQNLIYGNVAGEAGGGIYLGLVSEVNGNTGPINLFVTNNTIANNTINPNPNLIDDYDNGSQIAFGGYVSQAGLFNDIIIANDSYAAVSCAPTYAYLSGTPPVAAYSDIRNTGGPTFGGWCTAPAGSTGNISADPKFKDPANNDFHVLSGSPVIDAGFNATPGLLSRDLDGNPRIQNNLGLTNAIVDMGAYEAPGSPNLRSPSQISLSAPTTSVSYGQAVNLSATVSPIPTAPAGTVNLMDDWAIIGQSGPNITGTADFTASGLAVGTHWILASFGGNTQLDQSVSSAVAVVVQGFSTSTTLTFSSSQPTYSQPVNLTVTVTSASGIPNGIIILIADGATLATLPLNSSGLASFTTSSLTAGTHYVQAIYQGNGGFLSSSSINLPLQIQPGSTTITLAASSTQIIAGQSVKFTAAVKSSAGIPTGIVLFYDGTSSLGSMTLDSGGTAVYSIASLAAGLNSITAVYQGDTNHTGTTSSPVSETVQDFSLTAISAGTISLNPGQVATTSITVGSISGFAGTVSILCAVPSSMSEATCSATPVQITGTASATSTITISTTAPHQLAILFPNSRAPHSLGIWLSGIFVLCIPLCMGRRRAWTIRIATFALLTFGIIGCGGGSGSNGGSTDFGTPAGSYILTITASSGTASHTLSLNVKVQ